MYAFLIVYGLISLLYFIRYVLRNKKIDVVFTTLMSFLLSLLQGFRGIEVGTDTRMYDTILYYDLHADSHFYKNLEFGFVHLIKFFQLASLEEYFFWFVSFVANFLIIKTIFNLDRNGFLALLSYLTISSVYVSGFNILRQYLALCLYIYSLKFLFRSEDYKHILYIALCISLHYSSIFFMLFIFLYKAIKKGYFYIPLIFSLSLPFVYNFLSKNLILFFSAFTGKESVENYLGRSQESSSGLWFIFYLILTIYTYIFGRKNNLNFKFYFLVMAAWVSIFFNISFLGLAYEGPGRILICCYFSLIFIFSYLNYDKEIYLHYLILISLFFLYFIYMYYIVGVHSIFPYVSKL